MTAFDPVIRDVGLGAKLVTFGEAFSDGANRAALAFRAAVEAAGWEGVKETATSLTSTFVRYDPLALDGDRLGSQLVELLSAKDWTEAPLPQGRKLWRIPTTLGGVTGPQFEEAIGLAGLDAAGARDQIASARIRVLTIGFAPGQPYMGTLPEAWDIPRMSELNPQVPGASLVVAIRQLIIFAGPAPTGWRHIGQTAFRCFRPEQENPFALTPGDEVTFEIVDDAALRDIRSDPEGGASWEVLE